MVTVNEFDSGGNFVVWVDHIGEGKYRTGTIPRRVVQCLLWWVLDDGKDYGTFPMMSVNRKSWGAILGSFRRMQAEGDDTFEVLDSVAKG